MRRHSRLRSVAPMTSIRLMRVLAWTGDKNPMSESTLKETAADSFTQDLVNAATGAWSTRASGSAGGEGPVRFDSLSGLGTRTRFRGGPHV